MGINVASLGHNTLILSPAGFALTP